MPQTSVEPKSVVAVDPTVQSLHIRNETSIDASAEVVWESIIEQMEQFEDGQGKPMPFKLEARPGGRWFRDLGDGAGHLWGHVQVIKPPKLLEICGPLFMSYAATSHVQYRLTADGDGTTLQFTHTAIGLIPKEHREGVNEGWSGLLSKVKAAAEQRAEG